MLRWYDGFEHYGTLARMTEGVGGGAAWSEITGTWALVTTNPATQSYHLRLTDDSNGKKIIRRIFGLSKEVVGTAYRFAVASLPATDGSHTEERLILCELRDVANVAQCAVALGTDGSVFAYRGATVLGRSDPCVAAGGYHHFEVKAKIANTGGYIEVRINEITVLNLTSIDTQATANAEASQFIVGTLGTVLSGSTGFGTMDVDDALAWDDDDTDAENTVVDFVGDKGCYYLPPNGDTATSEFDVNGSATSYGAIDEVPPSGTDYLDTGLTAARTIVQVAALPGNVAEVIAFMPVIYARKEESGSVTMRGGIVVGSDESYGPDDSPSTEYAYLRPGPKTINPDTGVAWANTANPDLLIERTA